MKITKNNSKADLKLLIDVSCVNTKGVSLYEQFHRMLIRMSYKASNVVIDYARKRIYMNILAEDESYDSVLVNEFAETMAVNLSYSDLNTFLKSCILEDTDSLQLYYPFLVSRFFKEKPEVEAFEILETA